MSYRVIYHLGESMDTRTPVRTGKLVLTARGLRIDGGQAPLEIPFAEMDGVELFRLNGLGRMIRLTVPTGSLYVTVVWFCLGQVFACVNYRAAAELHRLLKSHREKARAV